MGRLAGFRYRQIIKKLKKFGFSFYRQAAGSHEIWYNEQTKRWVSPVKVDTEKRVNYNQISVKNENKKTAAGARYTKEFKEEAVQLAERSGSKWVSPVKVDI